MKAFEDYWDLTGLRGDVYYIPDAEKPEQFLVECINRKEEREIGWKAALAWACSQSEFIDLIDSNWVSVETIRKELEE